MNRTPPIWANFRFFRILPLDSYINLMFYNWTFDFLHPITLSTSIWGACVAYSTAPWKSFLSKRNAIIVISYFFVKYCWYFFYFTLKMRMHCPAVCISCNKEDAAGNEYPGNPGMYVYGMHIHFSRLRTHFVLNKKYNPNFLVILSKEIDPGRIV